MSYALLVVYNRMIDTILDHVELNSNLDIGLLFLMK